MLFEFIAINQICQEAFSRKMKSFGLIFHILALAVVFRIRSCLDFKLKLITPGKGAFAYADYASGDL